MMIESKKDSIAFYSAPVKENYIKSWKFQKYFIMTGTSNFNLLDPIIIKHIKVGDEIKDKS
jgi:hypothetical protein